MYEFLKKIVKYAIESGLSQSYICALIDERRMDSSRLIQNVITEPIHRSLSMNESQLLDGV